MAYKHKRSSVAGKVPVAGDFTEGQILVNTADGRAFILTPAGVVPIGSKEKAADSAKLDGKTAEELPVSTLTQEALDDRLNREGDEWLGFFSSDLDFLGMSNGLTIKPPLANSNFKSLGNNGNFTLAAPDNTGNYTMQIYVYPAAGAGSMTATGFTAPPKGTFKPSAINLLTIRVIAGSKYLSIEVME